MKITFYSTSLNHHQLPFCQAMYNKLSNDFCFVSTTPLSLERLNLGYHDMNKQYSFVLTTYDSEENKKEALQLALESDVVIIGSAPEIYISERMKLNKLTFRYCERICKKGRWTLFLPPRLYSVIKRYVDYGNDNLYMLCASAYTAGDFALINAYKGKTYKWGYFPEVKKFDVHELLNKKERDIVEILWVGRFIWWKCPEKVIYVARNLKRDNYQFKIKMIGTGERENKIKKLIKKYDLNDYIEILGSMPPEKVRHYMESANIFIFTSNYHEGWGAVVNEAMSSGCAVVASHAAGSVPYLIKHSENGLVYKSNSNKDFYKQIKTLMNNKDLCNNLGKNAYLTMVNEWNAENAAERFIHLCEKKFHDSSYKGEIGTFPCSIALPIPQGKIYKIIRNE